MKLIVILSVLLSVQIFGLHLRVRKQANLTAPSNPSTTNAPTTPPTNTTAKINTPQPQINQVNPQNNTAQVSNPTISTPVTNNNVEPLNKPTVLLPTPKANDLGNHNGLPVNNNTYGPQVKSGETHLDVISPEGKVDHIVVMDNQLNAISTSECAAKTEHYNLCLNISDCDICSASKFCGWCAKTSKCVAGSLTGTACPGDCLSSWIFNSGSCDGKVKAGYLDNVATNSTHLISPVISDPKIQINEYKTNTVDTVQNIQVGTQHTDSHTKIMDNQGTIHSVQSMNDEPIMGEVHTKIPVSQSVETHIIAVNNGTQIDLDNKNEAKVFHGN